jgi:predicted PurR-regulated permease PerM
MYLLDLRRPAAPVESTGGTLGQLVVLALWVVAFLAMLRLVEDYVIYPRLMRRSTQLNPLAVILSVLPS